jgi:hypothetical protein
MRKLRDTRVADDELKARFWAAIRRLEMLDAKAAQSLAKTPDDLPQVRIARNEATTLYAEIVERNDISIIERSQLMARLSVYIASSSPLWHA